MKIKIAILGLTLLIAALPVTAPPSFAAVSCRADYESIVMLKTPSFNTPTVWDARFGAKDSMIRLAGGALLQDDQVMVAGQEVSEDGKPLRSVLAVLDKRARVLSDKRIPALPTEMQNGMIKLEDGTTVIASTVAGTGKGAGKTVRIARYAPSRAYQSSLTLKDGAHHYSASGLAALPGGKGYMAAVQAVGRRDITDEYAVLARFGKGGKIIWKRAYRTGAAGQVYGLTAAVNAPVLAAGRSRAEDGRMAGWLMALNNDGTILWQNIYARGQTAFFRTAAAKPGSDHVIAAGQVIPYGDVPAALWITETDSGGNIVWQRYLRSADYNFDPRTVQIDDHGRIIVMANATARTEGPRQAGPGVNNHIRLLTLSPRGEVMGDEAYMQGRAATALHYLTEPNGERVVFASIESMGDSNVRDNELITREMARRQFVGPVLPEKKTETAEAMIRQGWIFAAVPLPPYADPCAPPPRKPAP